MIEIKIYLDPTTSQLVNFTTHPMISFYDYSSFAAVRFFRKHSSYLIVQDILNITMVYDCDYLNYWTLGGSLSTMFYVGIFTYNDIVYY